MFLSENVLLNTRSLRHWAARGSVLPPRSPIAVVLAAVVAVTAGRHLLPGKARRPLARPLVVSLSAPLASGWRTFLRPSGCRKLAPGRIGAARGGGAAAAGWGVAGPGRRCALLYAWGRSGGGARGAWGG